MGDRGTSDKVCRIDPPISAQLRARIDRDFDKRWSQTWGGRFILHGRTAPNDSVRLDGNDYLGLAGHPDIVAAQVDALRKHSGGVIQSGAFLHGATPSHQFEQEMAQWLGKEDGYLCQSGYAANLGLIQAVADEATPVYVDSLAHMSLWEGVRAARATGHAFRHNDPGHLDRLMQRHGPGLVIVDSVYSTHGSLCPLVDMVDVTERHAGMILVDESHSLGTHGPDGAGLCAQMGVSHRVHFITASLAKAFAGRAGFFTMPRSLRYYTLSESFPNIFSSCLLPHEVAGLAATLAIVRDASAERARLHRHARTLREAFADAGYPVANGCEQIIALEAGPEPETMRLRDHMENEGVIGAIFCAPATSRNRSLLRLTISAALTDAEIGHVVRAARRVAERVQPWNWPCARRQPSTARSGCELNQAS